MSDVMISFLCGGASGAIFGALVAHLLAGRRDKQSWRHAAQIAKENRMREFLGFLDGLRSEAERTPPAIFGETFPSKIHKLREETAIIRPDLEPDRRAVFDEALRALCQLTDYQVSETRGGDYQGRTRVIEAIDAVAESLA